MYPSLDPENYPGTPEYQEESERKAQRRQARHELELDQIEADHYFCRRY